MTCGNDGKLPLSRLGIGHNTSNKVGTLLGIEVERQPVWGQRGQGVAQVTQNFRCPVIVFLLVSSRTLCCSGLGLPVAAQHHAQQSDAAAYQGYGNENDGLRHVHGYSSMYFKSSLR